MAQGHELDRVYTYHPPDPSKQAKHEFVRNAAKDFAAVVLMHCGHSREQSLALTKIEEAVMWANAGIARNES